MTEDERMARVARAVRRREKLVGIEETCQDLVARENNLALRQAEVDLAVEERKLAVEARKRALAGDAPAAAAEPEPEPQAAPVDLDELVRDTWDRKRKIGVKENRQDVRIRENNLALRQEEVNIALEERKLALRERKLALLKRTQQHHAELREYAAAQTRGDGQ